MFSGVSQHLELVTQLTFQVKYVQTSVFCFFPPTLSVPSQVSSQLLNQHF